MRYFVFKQIAVPHPETFAGAARWAYDVTLADWIRSYVLELSYTSHRLAPYAPDLGDDGPPFRWDPQRRALLRAELDAAFLHIYGLDREASEHVLDSFFVVRKYEERDLEEFRTRRLVLEAYDRISAASAQGGTGWTSLVAVAAGHGLRHCAEALHPIG